MYLCVPNRKICSIFDLIRLKGENLMLNIRTLILSVALVLILTFSAQFVIARTAGISNLSSNTLSAVQNKQTSVNQSSIHLPLHRFGLDECFDVSLMELANCRSGSQVSAPAPSLYRSPLDECYDVPLREVTACRNASSIPIP